MLSHSCDDNKGVRLALGPILDMRAAHRLKDALGEALGTGRALTIEAKAVERVSTACIQVLIAYAVATAAAGIPFKLMQPSQVLLDAFDNLGLGSILQQWKGE